MRIHHAVTALTPGLVEDIKTKAKKLGLDKIKYDRPYNLIKLEAKNKSDIIQDSGLIMQRGDISLVGDGDDVWLYLDCYASWFKTSPIIGVEKLGNNFRIETQNSVYKLELVNDN